MSVMQLMDMLTGVASGMKYLTEMGFIHKRLAAHKVKQEGGEQQGDFCKAFERFSREAANITHLIREPETTNTVEILFVILRFPCVSPSIKLQMQWARCGKNRALLFL